MANFCNGCGLCCKLFLINLSKEEYQSGKYRTMFEGFGMIPVFAKVKECGANLLAQKADGSCIYLTGSKCGIHSDRPKVCRDFFCTSIAKRFEKMVEIIKESDIEKISSITP